MLVEVKADDIMFGCKLNGGNCPVARALARATGSSYVWVSRTQAMIFAGPGYIDYRNGILMAPDPATTPPIKVWDLPQEARQRIRAFDHNLGMVPFTFEL